MFVVAGPSTTILVTRPADAIPQALAALSSAGAFECYTAFEPASRRIHSDASKEALLDPCLELEDDERPGINPGGERVVRIVASKHARGAYRSKPERLTSVAVVYAAAVDPELLAFLKSILDARVRKLLVIKNLESATAAIAALNERLVHSILIEETPDFETRLAAQVRELQREYLLGRLSNLALLLAHGPTAFLNDPSVWTLIETTVRENQSEEIYLSLEPPGLLFRSNSSASEFLFICDEGYRRAIQEFHAESTAQKQLSADAPAPGFAEEAGAPFWSSLLSGASIIDADRKWLCSRFRAAGPEGALFEQLMASVNRLTPSLWGAEAQ